jgi:hypothetical protein
VNEQPFFCPVGSSVRRFADTWKAHRLPGLLREPVSSSFLRQCAPSPLGLPPLPSSIPRRTASNLHKHAICWRPGFWVPAIIKNPDPSTAILDYQALTSQVLEHSASAPQSRGPTSLCLSIPRARVPSSSDFGSGSEIF